MCWHEKQTAREGGRGQTRVWLCRINADARASPAVRSPVGSAHGRATSRRAGEGAQLDVLRLRMTGGKWLGEADLGLDLGLLLGQVLVGEAARLAELALTGLLPATRVRDKNKNEAMEGEIPKN